MWSCAGCGYLVTSAALSKADNFSTDVPVSTPLSVVSEATPVIPKTESGRAVKPGLQIMVLVAGLILGWISLILAASAEPLHPQHSDGHAGERHDAGETCASLSETAALSSVQIETSEMKLYEAFFESVLHAPAVHRLDHPQKDILRGYCYRGLLIVVRQDLQTPRPTGWVQINFPEQDVARIQSELQRFYEESAVSQLEEPERNRIVRFKLKPDVKRGSRTVARLEVFGPEGFMLGFDQQK